jgi:hypothetical protein
MQQHDPTKKRTNRRITWSRLLVCGCGVGFLGVGVFGLLANVLPALMIVSALIGLVLVCCGGSRAIKHAGTLPRISAKTVINMILSARFHPRSSVVSRFVSFVPFC